MSGMNGHNRQWYKREQVTQLEGTLKFDKIKRNVPYQITIPAGDISPEGVAEITRLLYTARIHMPGDFTWTWLKTRKTPDDPYIGTLPKRIANFCYKTHKIKLTRQMMENIGNIARAHTLTSTSVIFDITDNLDWEPGDFDDSGSCYWGDYKNARLALQEEGGLALRLFHGETKPCDCGHASCKVVEQELSGEARCWVVPYDGYQVLFNAYGEQLYTLARILSLATGLSYKKVEITNSNEVLYLNGDCVVVGKAENLDSLDQVDLDIGNQYVDMCRCDICGEDMHEDFIFAGPEDDNRYCEDCYNENHAECNRCRTHHLTDNISEIEGGAFWCNRCIDRYCFTCENCGTIMPLEREEADCLCTECYEERKQDNEPAT